MLKLLCYIIGIKTSHVHQIRRLEKKGSIEIVLTKEYAKLQCKKVLIEDACKKLSGPISALTVVLEDERFKKKNREIVERAHKALKDIQQELKKV